VLFGHLHELRTWQREGLHFVNLPAAGYRLYLNPEASLGWLRARIDEDGMRLEFRGISPGEREHGTIRALAWRTG
jgi:hypothetical protein